MAENGIHLLTEKQMWKSLIFCGKLHIIYTGSVLFITGKETFIFVQVVQIPNSGKDECFECSFINDQPLCAADSVGMADADPDSLHWHFLHDWTARISDPADRSVDAPHDSGNVPQPEKRRNR